jgi:hypothetical protein
MILTQNHLGCSDRMGRGCLGIPCAVLDNRNSRVSIRTEAKASRKTEQQARFLTWIRVHRSDTNPFTGQDISQREIRITSGHLENVGKRTCW